MRIWRVLFILIVVGVLSSGAVSNSPDGSLDILWFTSDGGGGTSSSDGLSISGTVGQPEASKSITAEGFTLVGGFWAASSASILEEPTPEIINDALTLDGPNTSYNPDDPRAPAGVFTVTATWTNTSRDSFTDVFVEVVVLSGGNILLNRDSGDGGVGSRISINLDGDGVLSPGESFTQIFEIGLQQRAPFDFFVNVLGTLVTP